MRRGLLEAIRGVCEFRNLLPRGCQSWPRDRYWEAVSYVLLAAKMAEAQCYPEQDQGTAYASPRVRRLRFWCGQRCLSRG